MQQAGGARDPGRPERVRCTRRDRLGLADQSAMTSAQSDDRVIVTTHTAASCSASLVEACAALMWETPEFAWAHNAADGKVDRHPSETVARMMGEVRETDNEIQSSLQWHTVMQGDQLLACAKSFVRVVSHSDDVKMPVLALGNVSCARAARGKG